MRLSLLILSLVCAGDRAMGTGDVADDLLSDAQVAGKGFPVALGEELPAEVGGFAGGGDRLLVLAAGQSLCGGEDGQRGGEVVLVGVGVAGSQLAPYVDGFAGA